MRTLLARGVLVLVVACFSRVIEAEEIDQSPMPQTPRVSDLLRDLSHPLARKSEAARTELSAVTVALHTAALKQRLSPVAFRLAMGDTIEVSAENADLPTDEDRAALWKKELPHLVPQMVEYLTWKPVDNWQPVMQLLVIANASDFLPLLEREKVLWNDERRLTAVGVLVQNGPYLVPRDRSLLAPIIKQLKALSPAMQQRMDEIWTIASRGETTIEGYSLAVSVGFVVMNFAWSDRIQVELPILKSLVEKDQAPWLRKVALTTLSELGEEASPVLEDVRRQLQDEDWVIRSLAAGVIVTASPGAVDIARLVDDANLKDRDTKWLQKLSEERKLGMAAVSDVVAPNDPESNAKTEESHRSLVLDMLQSRNQFFIRQGLRLCAERGAKGQFAKQEIETVLQLPKLDDETRRLAGLAIKAIDGN